MGGRAVYVSGPQCVCDDKRDGSIMMVNRMVTASAFRSCDVFQSVYVFNFSSVLIKREV